MARIIVVSFRLGGTDGVAIESAKWISALEALGHRVRTVAGEGEADVLLPSLAINAGTPNSVGELDHALGEADVVIVENLVSLPLNLDARDALYQVLDGRRAVFHHHDLPWQRPHLKHLEAPRTNPLWHHVTISGLSRRELAERGIEAVTIMNSFDCEPPRGNRDLTRRALDVGTRTLVVMPSRALPRKNVGGALTMCEGLDAMFWLLGPAEDGYESALEELIQSSNVEVRRGLPDGVDIHDAYAASDLVVMPSTWEGFGNPVLESVTHRRPLALYPYPVACEIIDYGFRFFELGETAAIRSFLDEPDYELLALNLSIAREHFNVASLPARLSHLLESFGVK
ncbi:MAG TPA: glycosyltransferase [Acidimicrobiales bacterium]|nr:glycosyltransferase [Acidimicrobiales bacterium]